MWNQIVEGLGMEVDMGLVEGLGLSLGLRLLVGEGGR